MKVAIAGATGLVGAFVVEELSKRSDLQIISLTRTPLASRDRFTNIVIDWEAWKPCPLEAEVFVCCLGTTIKKAGSEKNFRKVDFDYVKKFAEAAQLSQAGKFIFVSANGSNPKSTIFYNRVKGETEQMLARFQFEGLAVLRPSLLIGARSEKRFAEKVAQNIFPRIDFLLQGPLEKYQSIPAQKVAEAIVWLVTHEWEGLHIFESNQLKNKSLNLG